MQSRNSAGEWGLKTMTTLAALVAANAQMLLTGATGIIYVNSYYDGVHATAPAGVSRPLSTWYGSLAAAQVDYPAALALTDEVDWCVWQGALNAIYTTGVSAGSNWASATLQANGTYIVNRTIVGNFLAVRIAGTHPNDRFVTAGLGADSITYNGVDGTVDAPIYIFDLYLFDEFGNPPPGRVGNAAASGGFKAIIEHIVFNGKSGSMNSASQGVSGYISGVRLRQAEFCQISNCSFGGTLYDGIVASGAQLFLIIERNIFYGVHRDGIGIWRCANNSTTIWIYNNEFGWVGRYSIFEDLTGSVQAAPIIRDNSFEPIQNTTVYYSSHPNWWVQGVIAAVVLIGADYLNFDGNRAEDVTRRYPGVWGALHLVSCSFGRVTNSDISGIICTAWSSSARRTTAAINYYAANNFSDVTDQRNYNVGRQGDADTECQSMTFRNVNGPFYVADQTGFSSTGYHMFDTCNTARFMSIPVTAGTYIEQIQDLSVAAVSFYSNLIRGTFLNSHVTDLRGINQYGSYTIHSGTGDVILWQGTDFGQWQATHAYQTTPNNSAFFVGDIAGISFISPTAGASETGYFYQCTTAGTSGGSEPAWPTTIGGTVNDGSVVWTCVGKCTVSAEHLTPEFIMCGKRIRVGATPSGGRYDAGMIVWASAPAAGASMGVECTTGGGPHGVSPVWKAMPNLAA